MKPDVATWLLAAAALLHGGLAHLSHVQRQPADAQQRPLGAADIAADRDGGPLPPAGGFTKTEQQAAVCDAGSRQWTGKVGISDQSSLFYCTFAWRSSSRGTIGGMLKLVTRVL